MPNRLWPALLLFLAAVPLDGETTILVTPVVASAQSLQTGDAIAFTATDDVTLRVTEVARGEIVLRIVPAGEPRGEVIVLRGSETRELQSVAPVEVEVLRGDGRVSIVATDSWGRTVEPEPTASPAKRRAVAPHVPTPPSFDLIDKAETSGALDGETALLYRVYALFADARLPSQYRGDDSQVEDSLYLGEVRQRFATLSPATQAAVEPFLVPPAYTGSWAAHSMAPAVARVNSPRCQAFSGTWAFADGTKNPVRVWYRTDLTEDSYARAVVTEIDSVIWPKLVGVMQNAPLDDSAEDCNGGDGKLDVYLADVPESLAITYHGCDPTPAFIEMRRSVPKEIIAHEFMHAVQAAFLLADCNLWSENYTWWAEASATWAMDYVYRGNKVKQERVPNFLNVPEEPLDTVGNKHEYGAYLLPYYVEKTSGSADFVRVSWENCEHNAALEAVDLAVPNRFEKVWPDFVKTNWNQPPVDDYKKWDGLTAQAKQTTPKIQNAANTAVYDLAYELPRLSSMYYRILLNDSDASIAFWNGVTTKLAERDMSGGALGPQYVNDAASDADTKGAHVTALLRKGSNWSTEDWTSKPFVTYCRDLAAERVDELVVIISNSEFKERDRKLKPPGLDPIVYVSNVGCWQWKGTVTSNQGALSSSASVTWTRGTEPGPLAVHYTADGTVNWRISSPECSASGTANPGTAALTAFNYLPVDNPAAATYVAGGATAPVSACGASIAIPWWISPPTPLVPGIPLARWLKISADGKSMSDSYNVAGATWSWNLKAQRE